MEIRIPVFIVMSITPNIEFIEVFATKEQAHSFMYEELNLLKIGNGFEWTHGVSNPDMYRIYEGTL